MAEDVICLLDNLGWTSERELNIVGISLGGMIAQGVSEQRRKTHPKVHILSYIELAHRIPKRIASLVLAVTTPGGHFWNNFPPVRSVPPSSD